MFPPQVGGVVPQLIDQIIRVGVDFNNGGQVDLFSQESPLHHGPENQASDSAESVQCNFCGHTIYSFPENGPLSALFEAEQPGIFAGKSRVNPLPQAILTQEPPGFRWTIAQQTPGFLFAWLAGANKGRDWPGPWLARRWPVL
jgi:hypothetical protein